MAQKLKIVNRDTDWNPRYFTIFCSLFCGLYIITTVTNTKMIDAFGIVLPAGILLFPLCTIATDVINEVYGFNRTRQAVWLALILIILYSLMTQLVMILPYPDFWAHQAAYESLFGTSWRFALASCAAWIVGEFSNAYVLTKMKIMQKGKAMGVRFIGSTIVGQFFDTLVFMTIAFAGTMPTHDFVMACVVGWSIKIAYEIVILPFSTRFALWLKRKEGVEHFDKQPLSIL